MKCSAGNHKILTSDAYIVVAVGHGEDLSGSFCSTCFSTVFFPGGLRLLRSKLGLMARGFDLSAVFDRLEATVR